MNKMRLLAAVLILCAGCATINTADDYHGMGIENGEPPLETVEIENTGWLLFQFIPIGSGDTRYPNKNTCRLFQNTVTLQNNLNILKGEMERSGATRVANLSSRKTNESILFILFTRRAYHTSAVLLK